MKVNSTTRILLTSTVDAEGFPAVTISYAGHDKTRRVDEARRFATALLTASAIAQNEVGLFKGLQEIEAAASASFERSAMFVQLMRQFRPQLPFDIHAYRGLLSGQPYVEYPWPNEDGKIKLNAEECDAHARNILGCAEASETDAFLRHFLIKEVGIEEDDILEMLAEFSLFRQKVELARSLRNPFKQD